VTVYLLERIGKAAALSLQGWVTSELAHNGDWYREINEKVSPQCFTMIATTGTSPETNRSFRFIVSDQWLATHGVFQVLFVDEAI